MKVLKKEPDGEWQFAEIGEDLSDLQDAVGGYIETVTLWDNACVICNEDGRWLNLPFNGWMNTESGNTDFVGTILVVGIAGEDFCDVPDNINFDWWDG